MTETKASRTQLHVVLGKQNEVVRGEILYRCVSHQDTHLASPRRIQTTVTLQ
jgi:hypothetical protein